MFIGKKYKVEADDLNITISSCSVVRKGKNAGQEIWKAEGYFSTFTAALRWLVEHEVKATGITDFKAINKKQDELYELIEGIKNETLALPS